MRFADLVEKHSDELAVLESWDNGKPLEQAANAELPMFVRLMHYYAGIICFMLLKIERKKYSVFSFL